MAAFAILNMNINRVADRMAQQRAEEKQAKPDQQENYVQRLKRQQRRSGNWATDWR